MEAKPRVRRWTRTLAVAAVLVVGVTGCTTKGESDGGLMAGGASEAKCAYLVKYEGRSYLDVRGRSVTDKEFTVGKDLGTGLLPGCDESGEVDGTEKPEEVTVYEVEGIDPKVAVAAGATPGEAVLVAVQGADLTSLDAAS
ncbi:DUF6281 family protein [Streptomyces sp. NPDC056190]|uniref:DUF6281 family protein n=1 Tax=unclassified Streptomyces TaxID=2593676 RepID=UPI0035D8C6F2